MGTRFGLSYRTAVVASLLGIAAWAPALYAATFKVGTGPNCTHSTVAAAVATSESSAGPDTIRVTRSASYPQQAMSFNVTQEVTITGGFADCTSDVEDATYTTLDGSGGLQTTVMTINGATGSIVHLRKLTISGGDVATASSILGGGIYYTGNGLLDIANSVISNNTGAYGGGINVNGTGTAAELDIGPATTIINNIAFYNGGGVFSNNIETSIKGSDIYIRDNAALGVTGSGTTSGGSGGGIFVQACSLNSVVYLGSPGVGALGVVYNNSARYGGGISVEGTPGCSSSGVATLRMVSTDANQRTSIVSNTASVGGGGIYTASNGSQNSAIAYLYNASIINNTAPKGSALYLGGDGGGAQSNALFNNAGAAIYGGIACTAGSSCGEIRGNISSAGQVIYGATNNVLNLKQVLVSANQGTELIRLSTLDSRDSLISGNTSSLRLIETHGLTVVDTTIAGNSVGGADVLGVNTGGTVSIDRMIVWQPGRAVLHNDGSVLHILDVISNDSASLIVPGSGRLDSADPRFVDAVHGDYSLTAASPAVDFASAAPGVSFDLLTNPRDVDLPIVANRFGPRDIGAYERQALQPLVLNGTFNADLNIWPEVTVGASTWDSTQNAPGTPAGGALHVLVTGSSISARKQCVHLPGPGTYTLNGYGKSTGTITPGSYVSLGWEYRTSGTESCGGTVNSSGSLLLATNSAWNRPATPATIVVPTGEWTRESSVLVYLVVSDGPGSGIIPDAPMATLNGWFDAITLDVVGDRIFSNGFD